MNNLLSLRDGKYLDLSASALENLVSCPRKFQYSKICRREPVGTSPAIVLGSALHHYLANRYTHGYLLLKEDRERTFSEIGKMFEENPTPEDNYCTFTYCLEVIKKYEEQYKPGVDLLPFEKSGKMVVEVPFRLEVGEIILTNDTTFLRDGKETIILKAGDKVIVCWQGIIDLVAKNEHGLWIVDHKSTSMMGDTFFADFNASLQTLGYRWAAQHLGLEVAGVCINALGCRKPTKTGLGIEFQRQFYYYDQSQIDEWQDNTMQIIADLLSHYSRQYFPKHTTWCVGKYGKCQYYDVCSLPVKNREMMLTSNLYKENDARDIFSRVK